MREEGQFSFSLSPIAIQTGFVGEKVSSVGILGWAVDDPFNVDCFFFLYTIVWRVAAIQLAIALVAKGENEPSPVGRSAPTAKGGKYEVAFYVERAAASKAPGITLGEKRKRRLAKKRRRSELSLSSSFLKQLFPRRKPF